MMTNSAAPASMSGLVSPVKAPRSAKCMVWAPRATRLPSSASRTAVNQIVGGHTTVVTSEAGGASEATARASASASADVAGFIFQLPATTGLRINPPCPRQAPPGGEADGSWPIG